MKTERNQSSIACGVGERNVVPSSKKQATAIRNITKVHELFPWMWRQLEMSGPTIAIDPSLDDRVTSIYTTFESGQSLAYPLEEWCDIFSEIKWADIYDKGSPRCSVLLLQFIGQLGTYGHNEFCRRVYPATAVQMMHDVWDHSGTYLHYGDNTGSDNYLVSTEACERLLGAKIRVPFSEEFLADDWFLQGHSPG